MEASFCSSYVRAADVDMLTTEPRHLASYFPRRSSEEEGDVKRPGTLWLKVEIPFRVWTRRQIPLHYNTTTAHYHFHKIVPAENSPFLCFT